jgi:hypothetical protein
MVYPFLFAHRSSTSLPAKKSSDMPVERDIYDGGLSFHHPAAKIGDRLKRASDLREALSRST